MTRALVALVLAGCGPNLAQLVADHHDREAVCGAADGGSRDRARVGAALERDAGYLVHVQLVDRADVARLAAADPPPALRLVRIELRSNAIPVDRLAAHASLVDARGAEVTAPIDWPALAQLTGERLPANHLGETYATGGNLARGGAAVLTLGLSLLFTQFDTRTVELPPSDAEYAAAAPRAHALYHAFTRDHACTSNTGADVREESVRCTWFALLSPRADHVWLAVDQRYVAERVPPDSLDRCVLDRLTRVDLGPVAHLAAQFGHAMRPLDGVQAAPFEGPISRPARAAP